MVKWAISFSEKFMIQLRTFSLENIGKVDGLLQRNLVMMQLGLLRSLLRMLLKLFFVLHMIYQNLWVGSTASLILLTC